MVFNGNISIYPIFCSQISCRCSSKQSTYLKNAFFVASNGWTCPSLIHVWECIKLRSLLCDFEPQLCVYYTSSSYTFTMHMRMFTYICISLIHVHTTSYIYWFEMLHNHGFVANWQCTMDWIERIGKITRARCLGTFFWGMRIGWAVSGTCIEIDCVLFRSNEVVVNAKLGLWEN